MARISISFPAICTTPKQQRQEFVRQALTKVCQTCGGTGYMPVCKPVVEMRHCVFMGGAVPCPDCGNKEQSQ